MTTYERANLLLQTLVWIAMVVTFVVYYLQLRAMRHAAHGQNILALVNFLQTEEVRVARGVVRKTLRGKPFATWDHDDERAASLVCSSYDVAGILIRQGVVLGAPFVDNWGPSIQECFETLEPYVRKMQQPENSGAKYWDDFEWLYQQVRKVAA